jgi:hypothetical protein
MQPTKVGLWRGAISKVQKNRADAESSGLACSTASKIRADKELGRLVLPYGKSES